MPTFALRLVALLLALSAFAACRQGPQQEEKPPTILKVTPEILVLLQDRQQRCDRIAKRASERIREAEYAREAESSKEERPHPHPDDVLEKYLAKEAWPEFAATDRARQLVDSLLPKMAEEVSPEAARAGEALVAAQDRACESARRARSASSYRDYYEAASHAYKELEAKLLALIPISASDLAFAKYRYTALLEQTRVAATSAAEHKGRGPWASSENYERELREWEDSQQLMEQQRNEHEAAIRRWRDRNAGAESRDHEGNEPLVKSWYDIAPEKRAEAMRSWYGGYAGRVSPVRRALDRYTASLGLPKGADLRPVCRELLDSTSALLADPTALQSPDPAAGEALKAAFRELRQCAEACTKGFRGEAAFSLTLFNKAMGEAARALSTYSLQP